MIDLLSYNPILFHGELPLKCFPSEIECHKVQTWRFFNQRKFEKLTLIKGILYARALKIGRQEGIVMQEKMFNLI